MAKIVIVLPVYRVKSYLRRCVDSLLGQTYTDFDLILVNDGSDEGEDEICENYARKDTRIRVIHQPNQGLSAARNRGITWALSDSKRCYITFVDSDDWVVPTYLETLLDGCQRSKGCAALTAERIYADTLPTETDSTTWQLLTPERYWSTGSIPMSAWGKLYPASFFQQIRFPVGRFHEDEYTTHRLLFQADCIAVTTAKRYYYVQRKESIMGKRSIKRVSDFISALEEQADFFRNRGNLELATTIQFRLIGAYAYAIWGLKETQYKHALGQMLHNNPHLTPFKPINTLTIMLTAWVYYPCRRLHELIRHRGWIGAVKQYLRRFQRIG